MERRTDEEVLANEPAAFRLAGKDYEYREPGRRRARTLIARLASLVDGLGLSDTQLEEIDEANVLDNLGTVADRVEAVNNVLDWIYFASEECREDMKQIDDHADEEEIIAAFAAITGVLTRPFKRPRPAAATA